MEEGFHKLGKEEDFEHVAPKDATSSPRFKPSKPAEEHWLGEGTYFFLNPKGHEWAIKWPMDQFNPRTGSRKGIATADIDIELAIDLRIDEQRSIIKEMLDFLHLQLTLCEKKKSPVPEGELFYQLFRRGKIKEKVGFDPTAFIANFDIKYERVRLANSKVFLSIEKTEINPMTAQVQICIINNEIIKNLNLLSP